MKVSMEDDLSFGNLNSSYHTIITSDLVAMQLSHNQEVQLLQIPQTLQLFVRLASSGT